MLRKQQKAYAKEEKQSLRRQKKELHQRTALMRKRIRKDRLNYLKERLLRFLKQPIKIKKYRPEEIALRNAIKEDIKRERRERFQQFPRMVSNSVGVSVQRRRDNIRFFFMYLSGSLSGARVIKKNPELQSELIKTLFNSVVLFILAFIIAYYINQLITIFVASIYDIPAVLYSYRIFWPLYTYSSLYTRQALIVIFAAGPVLSIAMAVVVYQIFLRIRFLRYNFKILTLWILFHSINLFFGAYIAGVITRTGFVYTTEWIFYSQVFGVEEIIFLIVSIIILIISGFFLTRHFLFGTCSPALIEPKIRIFYILAQVLIPWVVGLGVLTLINYPRNSPELIILYFASALMIIPIGFTFNSIDNQMIRLELRKKGSQVGWIYFILLIVGLVIMRLIIYKGINFY
jgi:hypothetical protein